MRWLAIGAPLAIVFLPLTWLLLTRVVFPIRLPHIEGGRELIESQYRKLGPPNAGEWATFVVFSCTACLWVLRPIIANGWANEIVPYLEGTTVDYSNALNDAGFKVENPKASTTCGCGESFNVA